MDLDEGISEVAEFNSNRSIWSVDGFFFATKSTAVDSFEADAEGGGFTKNNGGEAFGVLGQGEDGEKVAWAAFFHKEREGGGVEGAVGHEAVDGVGEVFASDIVEVGTDFHDLIVWGGGSRRRGAEKGAEDVGAAWELAGAESVANFVGGK